MKEIKKVYGPYLIKNQKSKNLGRSQVVVYYTDGTRRTLLYSRHLMEQHLGRQLDSKEQVDHIDGDKTNDTIENLQVLAAGTHASLDAWRAKLVEISCIWCGRSILRTPRFINHYANQGKAGPFCGKSCVGKYGAEVQNKRIDKMEAQPHHIGEREYYKIKT